METKLLKEENVYKDKHRVCTQIIEQIRTKADDYKQLGDCYFKIGQILAGESDVPIDQQEATLADLQNIITLLCDYIKGYDQPKEEQDGNI